MQKLTFLIILAFIIHTSVLSQSCLPDGIMFYSQESIDNFQTNYPNCTEIEGNVWIAFENITNVDGLSVLTSIGGHLELWNYENDTSLNLSGFINLTSIGGDLNFYSTPLLSLSGFDNLNSIGRDLNIYECYDLTSLSGLKSLTSIGRDVSIHYSLLSNLSGLEKLSSIGGDLWIIQTSLTNLSGLDNLSSIGGDFHIKSNNALENLEGLSSLTDIGGQFIIGRYGSSYQGNPSLVNLLGLDNLISIGGKLEIKENDVLTDLSGLENLKFIGGDLTLEDNPSLASLTGLENLDTLSFGLCLINNEAIESISALQELSVLGGNIWIQYTNNLSSLSGLENINPEYIHKIVLTDNDSLSTCEVKSVCNYLASAGAEIILMRNAPGCNSKAEIEQACDAAGTPDFIGVSDFIISPNPANKEIFVSTKDGVIINEISIYNQLGQKLLHKKKIVNKIDISILGHGLYVIEIVSNSIKIREKLIISK